MAQIESELGRIAVHICDNLASSLQPKERIASLAYIFLSSKLCTKLSYRDAVQTLNLFLHRKEEDSVKLRTLADSMERVGEKIEDQLAEATDKILEMHGFDSETGIPKEGIVLSENIINPYTDTTFDQPMLQTAIDDINASREEKITFIAKELDIGQAGLDYVYVSIDDIGVKHQKDSRNPEFVKETKYIENTVAHIQHGTDAYVLTGIGMESVMKSVLAFLLFNGLLQKELVFFTDGARNIKSSIEHFFSFRPYTIVLDWFHLKKKSQELLSMALKGKAIRNNVLEKMLRILWVGDVQSAIEYLRSLPDSMIKSKKMLDEQINYLTRKEENITCYAVRAKFGLRNSSNPVEKENDILVAQRQKHNGMSWSKNGSGSLAAIKMVFENGYEDMWFYKGQISFVMPQKSDEALDFCA